MWYIQMGCVYVVGVCVCLCMSHCVCVVSECVCVCVCVCICCFLAGYLSILLYRPSRLVLCYGNL